jgi:sugar phosphate isomerase/epimerase
MFLGYNTNGLAHHDLLGAVELLAEIGYRGVAVTIDHNALSPKDPRRWKQIARLRRLLERLKMRSVIETGARFLLDPRVKHEPTLLSESRRRRIDFYRYAISCAAILGSDCVSLWSGTLREEMGTGDAPRTSPPTNAPPLQWGGAGARCVQAVDHLAEGLREVLDFAAAMKVTVAFEPEPGMLVDTMWAFEELLRRIDAPNLRLTLDIGHLQCQGELPIAEVIRRWAPRLANVHVEDMRRGVHEHLMFGEGEIDFPPVLHALAEVGYTGGVYVELPRHSHEGPEAARRAFRFLSECLPSPLGRGAVGAGGSANAAGNGSGASPPPSP